MAKKAEMKTLTLEDTTFEIVDAKAREMLGNTSVAQQIEAATEHLVTNEQLTILEEKVTESTTNVEQMETDLKAYVDEQIKLVEPDHIDDGEI